MPEAAAGSDKQSWAAAAGGIRASLGKLSNGPAPISLQITICYLACLRVCTIAEQAHKQLAAAIVAAWQSAAACQLPAQLPFHVLWQAAAAPPSPLPLLPCACVVCC